jgi:hypothetical protein
MENNQSFNLSINPRIQNLAKEVLNEDERKHAENIAETLLLDGHRDHAVKALQDLIGRTPKRPVYYLNNEIDHLPEETRDVIRYAGDYIDQLIKHCAHDKGKWRFLAYHSSLGPNLKRLNKILPESLLFILTKYNNFIYVQAKHSWDIGSRPHLFSSKDAVFVCFITKKLAEQIIAVSSEAKIYSENEVYNYYNN